MSCTCTPINKVRRPRTSPAPPRRFDCRGSAVVLVISVGTLMTLLVVTWVTFSVQRFRAVADTRKELHARYAAESAVSKAIYEWTLQGPNGAKTDSMKNFGVIIEHAAGDTADTASGNASVTYTDSVHRSEATATVEEEGSFLRITSNGGSGSAVCEIDALFGSEPPPEFRYALIVSDHTSALEVRRGRIIGDVKASLQPQGFIDGKVEVGTIDQLPRVNEGTMKSALEAIENKIRFPENAEIVLQGSQVFNGKSPLSAGKSLFVNGHLLIESDGRRPLTVRGPGTIIATGKIQISGNTFMEDVEILALDQVGCFDDVRLYNVTVFSQNTIHLGDRVRCTGNLYAYNTVTLAAEAVVEMPGFAYVKGSVSADPKSLRGVQLTEQSRFSGTVFCETSNSVSFIDRDARFTGIFYTRGNLILEGTVFGCVAAVKLVDGFEGQRNVLAGGTINRKILPKNFVIPCAFNTGRSSYRLVSWSEKMDHQGRVASD